MARHSSDKHTLIPLGADNWKLGNPQGGRPFHSTSSAAIQILNFR